jgi:hypothetical protein
MAGMRMSMRKIREVLRLTHELGLSVRQVPRGKRGRQDGGFRVREPGQGDLGNGVARRGRRSSTLSALGSARTGTFSPQEPISPHIS